MRLFTVDHEWVQRDNRPALTPDERALEVTHGEHGWGVYFHDKEMDILAVPLGEDLKAQLKGLPQGAKARLRSASLRIKEDKRAEFMPPGLSEAEAVARGSYYGPCLVHLCIDSGALVPVTFTSSTYDEVLIEPQRGVPYVTRAYHPLERAVGIDILCLREDKGEGLFRLWPCASLRVQRAEQGLSGGVAPSLMVVFDGRDANVIVPKKYRKRQARERVEPAKQAFAQN